MPVYRKWKTKELIKIQETRVGGTKSIMVIGTRDSMAIVAIIYCRYIDS